MLKTLDELERAVSSLMEKGRSKEPDGSVSGSAETPLNTVLTSLASGQSDQTNEEVADLIRRAIKRLKSL